MRHWTASSHQHTKKDLHLDPMAPIDRRGNCTVYGMSAPVAASHHFGNYLLPRGAYLNVLFRRDAGVHDPTLRTICRRGQGQVSRSYVSPNPKPWLWYNHSG